MPYRLICRVGRDLAYLFGMLGLSVLAFTVWFTGLSVTLSLAVLVIGFVAWTATARALRAITGLDRRLAGWYRHETIRARYRTPPATGALPRARSASRDPQTWRDLGWTIVDSLLGFTLSVAAITLTGLVIGWIVLPLWWWAIPEPANQYATLNLGIYTVTSTGWALATTAIGLALAPVALAFNHAVASTHARRAAKVLGPHASRPTGVAAALRTTGH